ncbi:hypothetical protein JW998_12555 [candidate division KSB1 bacterium]|nr:hypothetical protein [candidate division KSB1 bacterium]
MTFAKQARYVLQQLGKMMGVKMIEINDLSERLPLVDALLFYGRSVPTIDVDLPIIYCAQVNYAGAAGLTPHDVRTIVTAQPDLPAKISYLFSSDIPQQQNPLYADEKTLDVMISWSEKKVQCAVDIISTCFYFLSLENERRATDRDVFHRFQRPFSPVGEVVYESPVVDRYAKMLKKLLLQLAPHLQTSPLWPDNKSFALALSHDVDRIPTWTITKMKRVLRADHSPYANALIRTFRLAQSLACPENWLGNFNFISRLEQRFDAASTFFFISRHRHELDPKYKMNSQLIRQGMEIVQKRGCDIGLHGTIPSATESGFLELEKEDLEFFIDKDIPGGRQHYLCYTHDTLQLWQDAKLKYDSTLGFSNHTGYRCGTGFPFQLHDGERPVPLLEIPLILMDTVLLLESKQFLSAAEAWRVIEKHLEETRDNNSLLTINWHSSELHPVDVYGYSLLYSKILGWVQENDGWLASLNQVYDWWTLR